MRPTTKIYGLALAAVMAAGVPLMAQDDGGRPDGGGRGYGGGGFAGGQRVGGTVTGVAGDKMTVKTENGDVYTIVTTTNTRVMKERQPIKLADIPVGSMVGAMGLLDAATKTEHAMMVMVVDPEQQKKMREAMGKSYIAGKVEKIEETTLTVMRSDGVEQKIEVDENTSFRRGGRGMRAMQNGVDAGGPPAASGSESGGKAESITLLDIKVGDTIAGPGALKNGVFVAKEIGVLPPGMGRRRRPGSEGGAAGPGPAPQ